MLRKSALNQNHSWRGVCANVFVQRENVRRWGGVCHEFETMCVSDISFLRFKVLVIEYVPSDFKYSN